jgi:nitroreductase
MGNEVTKLIQSHRSIRRFTDEPISEGILNDLLTSAQWAPSSHNGQTYSIIVIKNEKTKRELSKVCMSQKWVISCPVFLVFCIDFYRLKLTAEMHGAKFESDEVENLLVGAVDSALAAENLLVSARSYGLSGVMMGGIREDPEKVIDLLNLPLLTFPLMGMCLGYPEGSQWQKPRLPQKVVVHQESYRTEQIVAGLQEYDLVTADYYTRRTNGKRTDGWTKQMAEYFSQPQLPNLKSTLLKQGFNLK